MTDMTDDDKELIEQTVWPSRGEDATADALIVHAARLAVAMSAESHELMTKAFALDRDDPDRKPALRAYMDQVVSMVAQAQVADLLVAVQNDDRALADTLAHRIWSVTEDGGVITELMWEYLDDRGIDADAVFELAERDARANHMVGSGE
jgi:hypothetical protein